jgi:ABC-type nitrate/sulfonate/bicarbonate transport system substrate-binding protein
MIAALAASCAAAIVFSAATARANDAVSVQLRWHHQTQFAGLYVAEAKGYYRAEGLDVRHREWRVGDKSPIEQVAGGAADFGITSQAQFLVEREKGVKIVAIAAVYQRSPITFFALKTSGIKHPRDFAGRTIAFAPAHDVALKAVLKRVGMDVKALKRTPYGFDLTPFYRGETAIWAGSLMNEPVDAKLAGFDVNVIFPDDYGVPGYGDILFTSEDLIRRKPAVVERWVRAAMRGWRYAIGHVEEATTLTCALRDSLRRDKQAAMLVASIPLIHTGERPLGFMTRAVWQGAAELLHEHDILARVPPMDGLYTTAFVERSGK